jgi:hypothetical protein
VLAEAKERRESMPVHQCDDQSSMGVDEGIGCGDQTTSGLARKRRSGRLDFLLVAHGRRRKVSTQRSGSEFA